MLRDRLFGSWQPCLRRTDPPFSFCHKIGLFIWGDERERERRRETRRRPLAKPRQVEPSHSCLAALLAIRSHWRSEARSRSVAAHDIRRGQVLQRRRGTKKYNKHLRQVSLFDPAPSPPLNDALVDIQKSFTRDTRASHASHGLQIACVSQKEVKEILG